MQKNKIMLVILPTFILAYFGQRQIHADFWVIIPSFFQVALLAMATYLSICGGIFIFMKCREISEADKIDIRVIHASVLGVVYAVLIFALASGMIYRDDRAKARDYLMDRAVDYLREQGESINVANLKRAMRLVEEEED